MNHFFTRLHNYGFLYFLSCLTCTFFSTATEILYRAPRHDAPVIPDITTLCCTPRDAEFRNLVVTGTLLVEDLIVIGTCSGTCGGGGTSDLYVLRTGDTMTGSLTITGGHELLLADEVNGNTVGFVAPPGLSASYTLTFPVDAGAPNTFLTTDGTGTLSWTTVSGAGITSLNGQIGISQTFANAITGIQPAFTSLSNVHTLSIPMAHTPGVLAGLISHAEFDAFSTATSTLLTSSFYQQGGNTFATTGILGLTDANTLNIITNNTPCISINSAGSVSINAATTGNSLIVNGNANATAEIINPGAGQIGLQVSSNGAPAISVFTDTPTGIDITASGIGTGISVNASTGAAPAAYFIGNNSVPAVLIDGNTFIHTNGELRLGDADTNYIALKAPFALSTDYTYTLPVTYGTPGQVLTTIVDGLLTWSTSGGTGSAITSINGLTDTAQYLTTSTVTAFLIPQFDEISSATHELQLPMAHTPGVLAGLISHDEFDAFSTATSGNFYQQGGNAFGTTGILGLTDAQPLNIITNNTPRIVVSSDGGMGITQPAASQIALSVFGATDVPAAGIISGNPTEQLALIVSGSATIDGNITLLTNGELRLNDVDTNYIALKAPFSLSTDYTYTLPSAYGTPGQVLTTVNDGLLTWSNGGASAAGITSLNGLTDAAQYLTTTTITASLIPEFDEISSATHELQLPMAHTPGVIAGLISNAEFNTFSTSSSTTAFYRQGGNDFGMDGILGLTSTGTLNIITDNTTRIELTDTGNITLAPPDTGLLLSVSGGAHVTGALGAFTSNNTFNVGLPNTATGIANTPRQTQQLCLALTASGTDADNNHIRVFVYPIVQFAAGVQSSGFFTANFCDTAKIDPEAQCTACGFIMIPNGQNISSVLIGSRLGAQVNNIYSNGTFATMSAAQQTAADALITELGYPTWEQDAVIFVLITVNIAPSVETDFSIMQTICVG